MWSLLQNIDRCWGCPMGCKVIVRYVDILQTSLHYTLLITLLNVKEANKNQVILIRQLLIITKSPKNFTRRHISLPLHLVSLTPSLLTLITLLLFCLAGVCLFSCSWFPWVSEVFSWDVAGLSFSASIVYVHSVFVRYLGFIFSAVLVTRYYRWRHNYKD